MKVQKYAVNQHLIASVLSKVKEGEIAIPEIQRPFVWNATDVRDLLDSLYKGYPVGYLIAWHNPDVKLKDGSTASGKMILIDGQQRITALTTAVLGQPVVNKEYCKVRISIAFHPIKELFEVSNPAIAKDAAWIPDVAVLFNGAVNLFSAVAKYSLENPRAEITKVQNSLMNLTDILNKQIGLIELSDDLDLNTVTEIFSRINIKGKGLSQADFAMSKIAADQLYGGQQIRKCIDYFCHLAVAPDFLTIIKKNDSEFAATPYFQKMVWLKNKNDHLYDPSYNDLLRVAFTSEFGRSKLADLVSLLSGRDFETKKTDKAIAEASFFKLNKGVLEFINNSNFNSFVMIIKSAGFISNQMIRSRGALNFAYIVYLRLRAQDISNSLIASSVSRWFVMSVLTKRYSSSSETQFDTDVSQIERGDFAEILGQVEQAKLSSVFWEVGLKQDLATSGTNSPYFWVFIAAQVRAKDKGLFSKDFAVHELVSHVGDIHHIFPKDLLKKKPTSLPRSQYDQIANLVYTQQEVNIKIGNKKPCAYFADMQTQCTGGPKKYGAIDDLDTLKNNLIANCVPIETMAMDIGDFDHFLTLRRSLMADKIRAFYQSL